MVYGLWFMVYGLPPGGTPTESMQLGVGPQQPLSVYGLWLMVYSVWSTWWHANRVDAAWCGSPAASSCLANSRDIATQTSRPAVGA